MKSIIHYIILSVVVLLVGCDIADNSSQSIQSNQDTLKLSIITPNNVLFVDSLITFSCSSTFNDSSDTELEWAFGVSSPREFTINSHTVTHRFIEAGLYTISLTLRNVRTQDTIAQLDTVLEVVNTMDTIPFKKYKYISTSFIAPFSFTTEIQPGGPNPILLDSLVIRSNGRSLQWSGKEFHLKYTYKDTSPDYCTITKTTTVYGKMNDDFTSIDTLSVSLDEDVSCYGYGSSYQSISCNDIPRNYTFTDTVSFYIKGTEVRSNISTIVYTYSRFVATTEKTSSASLDSINWGKTFPIPKLHIKFY